MTLAADFDAHTLRAHLGPGSTSLTEPRLGSALVCNSESSSQLHLAVMTGSFLKQIIAGVKIIESRFHRVRQAPLYVAAPGDVIAFKQAGGPVRATAVITNATFVDLQRTPLDVVRARYQEPIAATDDEFWASRINARWVSLLSLSEVREVQPIAITKRDRRGWVRYSNDCSCHPERSTGRMTRDG